LLLKLLADENVPWPLIRLLRNMGLDVVWVPEISYRGISNDEIIDIANRAFIVIVCPRCKNKNSPISKFCNARSLCLNLKTTVEIDEVRAKADTYERANQKPKVLDALLGGVERLKRDLGS